MSEAGTRPKSAQGGAGWPPLQPSLSWDSGPGDSQRKGATPLSERPQRQDSEPGVSPRSPPLRRGPRKQMACSQGPPTPGLSAVCGYCFDSLAPLPLEEPGLASSSRAGGRRLWYCWHASGAAPGDAEGCSQSSAALSLGAAAPVPESWYSWDASGIPESPPKATRRSRGATCPPCEGLSGYCWDECCAGQALGASEASTRRASEGGSGADVSRYLWEEEGAGAAQGEEKGERHGSDPGDPQAAGASGIWDNSDVAEEVLSHLPIGSLCSAAMVCRAWKEMADSDMVWGKKLRRIHAGSGADRPGPLPFSVGPGRWKALARSLRHFYSQWGYPLQLKGVAATGQSSHHGIFEAKWTLSDMHYWCSRVLRRPESAEESLSYRISDTPDTFVMALEVVPARKANFVTPKSVTMEVGKSGESYHFSHTFALESSPVTNLLKLPQHCSAVGSHVKLTFRGCHQEEQPLGPSRLSRQTSSRHFCIKRVRFLGVPADVFAEEELWRAIKVE